MPRTPSSTSRVSVSYGAARVTVARSSSTGHGSITVIATSCWARTSSGLRGISVGLDRALVHPARHDGAFEQVAAVLREDHALARGADLVTRPADSLETAGHARRALDLDHEVDRAHVDPQLERARGDERRQPARLELLLDRQPLLAGDAAVVGPDQLLAGQLVEPLRESLREPAAVDEDDRAAVRPDLLEDRRVDRRPDARPAVRARRRAARLLVRRQDLAERGHVVDGDDDLEVERLARAGVDDRAPRDPGRRRP